VHISTLSLRNFRSYEEMRFTWDDGVNVIYGDNARGKTNLLEALYFLVIGRSFRVQAVKNLIRDGADAFYLQATFQKYGVDQKVAAGFDGTLRRTVVNSTTYPSFTNLVGVLYGVVCTPDDNSIIMGAPQVRRRYLDIQLAQSDPLYMYYLCRYNRALKQRNILLRKRDATTIEVWEQELATAAAYLSTHRKEAVATLEERSAVVLRHLSKGVEALTMVYKGSSAVKDDGGDITEAFVTAYGRNRRREMEIGHTIVGPHRDDILLYVDGKEARVYCSEGQKRSCAVAMKIAEWQRLRDATGETPIMAVDDVEMAFDGAHREALNEILMSLGQVFITSTQKLPYYPEEAHIEIGREKALTLG
jgi:DNA replication and repair protein RecF